MGKTSKMTMLALLLVLFDAAPAAARQGLFLGVNVPFNKAGGDLNELEPGNGIGMNGGYRVNRCLSFVADVFRTNHALRGGDGSLYLKGITVDAKVNIPVTGSIIEPYVRGGAGKYSLDNHGSVTRGAGTQAGFGIDIILIPEVRFYLGLTKRRLDFNARPQMKGSVSSFEYGMTFSFR